jgi:nicotinamidase-related amidase
VTAFEALAADPVLASLAERWRGHLDATDIAVIERAGYGRPVTAGTCTALILVDFQRAYVGDDVPILDQLDVWPSAGGAAAWSAARVARTVVDSVRRAGDLIVFSRIAYPAEQAATNPFESKRGGGAGFILGTPGTDLVLEQRDDEPLLTKTAASAFYETELDGILAARGIDTLLVCGLSTSGCVRATVVDAAARGYRVFVIADACADRIGASHEMALFDIWLKYGGVVSARMIEQERQP